MKVHTYLMFFFNLDVYVYQLELCLLVYLYYVFRYLLIFSTKTCNPTLMFDNRNRIIDGSAIDPYKNKSLLLSKKLRCLYCI